MALGEIQTYFKRRIKISQNLYAVKASLCYFVQFFLHKGSEFYINNLGKILNEHIRHLDAKFCRVKIALYAVDIAAVYKR